MSATTNFSNQQSKTFNPLELLANNKYSIVKFWLFKNSKTGYITTDDGKDYWINKTCYEILEDYFKMQNGKLTCIYNIPAKVINKVNTINLFKALDKNKAKNIKIIIVIKISINTLL